MHLWFLLDFSTREHNLMEKFEQNQRKISVRLWFLLDTFTCEHNLMEKLEQNRKKILVRLCVIMLQTIYVFPELALLIRLRSSRDENHQIILHPVPNIPGLDV